MICKKHDISFPDWARCNHCDLEMVSKKDIDPNENDPSFKIANLEAKLAIAVEALEVISESVYIFHGKENSSLGADMAIEALAKIKQGE